MGIEEADSLIFMDVHLPLWASMAMWIVSYAKEAYILVLKQCVHVAFNMV